MELFPGVTDPQNITGQDDLRKDPIWKVSHRGFDVFVNTEPLYVKWV